MCDQSAPVGDRRAGTSGRTCFPAAAAPHAASARPAVAHGDVACIRWAAPGVRFNFSIRAGVPTLRLKPNPVSGEAQVASVRLGCQLWYMLLPGYSKNGPGEVTRARAVQGAALWLPTLPLVSRAGPVSQANPGKGALVLSRTALRRSPNRVVPWLGTAVVHARERMAAKPVPVN